MVALIERVSAAGHNPFDMTVHQLLAFGEAAKERRRHERAFAALDARAARASDKAFEEHIRDSVGVSDPDTLDFSDDEDDD